MKQRQWTVRRHLMGTADAQQRWDRTYQYLVQWSLEVLRELPSGLFPQESRDESCYVCASVNPATGSDADA